MDRLIFVSLPVRDVSASRSFYRALGFRVDGTSGDDDGACAVVTHGVCLMLLPRDRWTTVTQRPPGVALLGLSAATRAEVDALAEAAVAGGGAEVRAPRAAAAVYARAVRDPDGHVWEVVHAEPGC